MRYTKRDTLRLIAGGAGALLFSGGANAQTSSTALARRVARREARVARAEVRRALRLARRNARIAARNLISQKYRNNFKIGAALNTLQIDAQGLSAELARKHFNSITTDYELKHPYIITAAGEYDFTLADKLVNWALDNGKEVRGHTLLWHIETPDYMLEGTP